MKRFFDDISDILSQDPGGRGLMRFLPRPDPAPAYAALGNVRRALIVTGFPIRTPDGRIACETDGPAGAADMAHALAACGAAVGIATDETSFAQVRAAADCRAPAVRTYLVRRGDPAAARRLVLDLAPTHVIAIERPGKAADGHFYTSRGAMIDDLLADTDLLYSLARESGALSIAIGDGGNEAGMACLMPGMGEILTGFNHRLSTVPSTVALPVDVSNWGAYALACLLSCRRGQWLGHGPEEERRMIEAMVSAGAVDGVTGRRELSVDGLPVEEHAAVVKKLREIYESVIGNRRT